MLGWHIIVFRQDNSGVSPATFTSKEGSRLAVWQTGLHGLNWIDELVKEAKAVDLGGNGYPLRYTAKSEHLVSHILPEPPLARATWRTVIDPLVVSQCRPDEWLLIEAWDES